MPRKKKATFTPKKKKTVVSEPKWEKLQKAKTEEDRRAAWLACEDFVQHEVTEKEHLHSFKRWIELESGWNLDAQVKIIPDVYLRGYAKNGWKARKLGYMPESVRASLERDFKPTLLKAEKYRLESGNNIEWNMPTDHPWHPDKVKQWLKKWQVELKSIKSWEDDKEPSKRMQFQVAQTYVYNLSTYLRTGVWLDSHWGENREYKVLTVCKTPAFDEEGNIKRTRGVYYPDIGMKWSESCK